MKLIVKHEYHNSPYGIHLAPGTLEVDDKVASFVLRDAPDNFEVVAEPPLPPDPLPEPRAAALEKPPKDRAMRKGAVRG